MEEEPFGINHEREVGDERLEKLPPANGDGKWERERESARGENQRRNNEAARVVDRSVF